MDWIQFFFVISLQAYSSVHYSDKNDEFFTTNVSIEYYIPAREEQISMSTTIMISSNAVILKLKMIAFEKQKYTMWLYTGILNMIFQNL